MKYKRQKNMLDVITRIQSAKSRLWETLWTNNLVSSTNKLMGKKYSQHLRDNWNADWICDDIKTFLLTF